MTTSFTGLFTWLFTGSHWTGSSGLGNRLLQHIGYTAEVMAIACVIALPLGLWSGHTGRLGGLLSSIGNAGRALPTLGLVVLFAILLPKVTFTAALIPLVLLAIPSILVNTYEGVLGVDATLSDAARGMGLTPLQVLVRVEIPVALPLIVLGLRTAALQVISTATIAAFIGLGGLGRFIIDGLANRNYAEVGAGALVVAALAIVTERLFLLATRLLVSPGLRSVDNRL